MSFYFSSISFLLYGTKILISNSLEIKKDNNNNKKKSWSLLWMLREALSRLHFLSITSFFIHLPFHSTKTTEAGLYLRYSFDTYLLVPVLGLYLNTLVQSAICNQKLICACVCVCVCVCVRVCVARILEGISCSHCLTTIIFALFSD